VVAFLAAAAAAFVVAVGLGGPDELT